MENPDALKYSDLIKPDNSIEQLIGQLKEVISQYDTLKSKMQTSAGEMAKGLQAVSGATEDQRKAIQQTTEQTEKLTEDYKQVFAAQMQAKQAVLEYKAAKKEEETVTKLLQQINTSAEGSYNRLSAQYRLNKLRLNEMSAAQRTATEEGRKLEAETAQIYEQMNQLQKATGKFTLQVGNYEIAGKSLRTELMSLTQQMAQMRIEGKANSEEYKQMAERAGTLKDAMMDATAEVKNMGSDTRNLDSVMGAASVARGGLGAFAGTMALLGANSEGASKAQKVLAGVIGIITGLTAVQNALQKQSALMIALRTLRTKLFTKSLQEETAATAEHTAAMGADAAATQAATAATSGFKKALIATGIGALVVLVGELAAHWHEIANAIGLADDESDKYFEDMKAGLGKLEKTLDQNVKIAEAMGLSRSDILRMEVQNLQQLSHEWYEYYSQQYDYYNDLTLVEQWFAKESNASIDEMLDKHKEYFENMEEKLFDLKISMISYIYSMDTARRQEGMTEFEKSLDNIKTKAVDAAKAIDILVSAGKMTPEQAQEYTAQVIATMEFEMEQEAKKEKEKAKRDAESRAQKIKAERKAAQTIADNAADALRTDSERLERKYNEDLAKLEKYGIDADALTRKYLADLEKIRQDDTRKYQEQQKVRLSADEKAIQLRLSVVKKGGEEEINLQAELWEKQRQRELLENAMLDESIRQNEADINAKWDAYILEQTTANAIKRAEALLKIQQEYAASEFALLDKNERQKAIFQLGQERARLVQSLELNKAMTEEQRKTILNQIAKIDKEVSTKGYDNLYELLGISLNKEQQSALNTALESVKDSIGGVIDAWKEAADRAVDSADKQVESAERILQAEIEARNAGYANNVETAKRELDLAKRTQREAQQERARAQKAELAADAAMQSSSLITATANIWKALSGIPGFGPALAVTAIATMWGSFIASKAKAAELTEKYGEGTVELLQGGSHASGNDIDLGRKRDGTRRRAEGGEFFAVINKRSSRRFRSVIPDVINSFNNGTFAERYQRANGALDGMAMSFAGTDVSGLERDVRAIRSQGETTLTQQGGYIVEKYKNLTKKYKA